MTTAIEAIERYRQLQKRDCWMDVYDAILELHARAAAMEADRPQIAIRDAALEEAAKLVEDFECRSEPADFRSAYHFIAGRVRALKSTHRPTPSTQSPPEPQ